MSLISDILGWRKIFEWDKVAVEQKWDDLLTKFVEILRIPSVNADPDARHEVARSAELVRQWFTDIGLDHQNQTGV